MFSVGRSFILGQEVFATEVRSNCCASREREITVTVQYSVAHVVAVRAEQNTRHHRESIRSQTRTDFLRSLGWQLACYCCCVIF
jgi:hypothetical protein